MEYESLVNTSTSIGAQSEINLGPGLRHRPLLRGHQEHHLAGQLKIIELRQLAETSLGEQFDIKEFHDIVLNSVGPLSVLEDQILNYVNSRK